MGMATPVVGIRVRSKNCAAKVVASLDIQQHPSPNFGPRRDGAAPSLIVIHYTAMDTAENALSTLCNPATEVSAHYLIGSNGHIWQMVAEKDRAWHAGAGQWGSMTDVNSHSIGIELDNKGDHPFAEPQMLALEQLLQGIMQRWSIPAVNVIAHSDLAPHRKIDPGRRFDWRRLALQGLAVWPDDDAADTQDWATAAAQFGYPLSLKGCDDPQSACFTAYRSRFRPWAKGPLDAEDQRRITCLSALSAP